MVIDQRLTNDVPGQDLSWTPGFARWLWFLWVVFVVYGSLVPLEFRPLTLEEALERFAQTQMLDIGLQGRADWIANGVLYVPVGFLTVAMMAPRTLASRLFCSLMAVGFGVLLAVAVEFSQLFFPPRTVSLNDLLAETLGTMLGVFLAWRGQVWLSTMLAVLRGNWREVANALLPAGALLVVLVSWFPFDLLLSSAELAIKANSDFWGWFVAPVSAGQLLPRMLARLGAEVAVLVPLGALWARSTWAQRTSGSAAASLKVAFWLGVALGLLIEVGQWFVFSGVSQGLSVLTRGLGWMLGAWLWNRRQVWGPNQWRAGIRRFLWPLASLHLVGVLILSGWTSGAWRTTEAALARLDGDLRLVPFYYHYYTSEAIALQSLLAVAFLYAPIALWCWALSLSPRVSAFVALLVAFAVEAGKLFPASTRPDPTNLLIAAMATGISVLLLQKFSQPSPATFAASERRGVSRVSPVSQKTSTASPWVWVLLMLTGVLAVWLLQFPVNRLVVAAVLTLSAVMVWWRPVTVFGVLAAALPSWDLTALSGREYIDEFDMLLLLSFAVAWVRQSSQGTQGFLPAPDAPLNMALGVFALSALLCAFMAWQPWDIAALRDPDSPLSPWYGLRLFKGVLWATCAYLLARRQLASELPVVPAFGVGLVVGLAYTACFVFWERAVFPGVWDFSVEYRVAGPVVPMRLGGAYLDAFLIASLPFAVVGALTGKSLGWRAFCALTALAAIYAVAVTFTRTTYLAAGVAALVAAAASVCRPGFKRARPVMAICLTVAMAAIAYPIVSGPFASARMANVKGDFQTRLDHFSKVLAMGSSDFRSVVLGHGLGRFPAESYWHSVASGEPDQTMAVHRFVQSESPGQLQLGAGPSLYVDQLVDVQSGESVTLELLARSVGADGSVAVLLCQKWLLSSENCVSSQFSLTDSEEGNLHSSTLLTGAFVDKSPWLQRPVRLALNNAGPVRVDIDSVSMRNADGVELLRNGDFTKGSDHWSYTSDDHLSWHAKNLFLAVWFDQGLVGLFALLSMFSMAIFRSARGMLLKTQKSFAFGAALTGLLVAAMFDSITDEPRYLLLVLCMAWMAALHGKVAAMPKGVDLRSATPSQKARSSDE